MSLGRPTKRWWKNLSNWSLERERHHLWKQWLLTRHHHLRWKRHPQQGFVVGHPRQAGLLLPGLVHKRRRLPARVLAWRVCAACVKWNHQEDAMFHWKSTSGGSMLTKPSVKSWLMNWRKQDGPRTSTNTHTHTCILGYMHTYLKLWNISYDILFNVLWLYITFSGVCAKSAEHVLERWLLIMVGWTSL